MSQSASKAWSGHLTYNTRTLSRKIMVQTPLHFQCLVGFISSIQVLCPYFYKKKIQSIVICLINKRASRLSFLQSSSIWPSAVLNKRFCGCYPGVSLVVVFVAVTQDLFHIHKDFCYNNVFWLSCQCHYQRRKALWLAVFTHSSQNLKSVIRGKILASMWPPPFHSDALLFVLLFQAALWGQKNNYYKSPLRNRAVSWYISNNDSLI